MDYTTAPNYIIDGSGRRQIADRDLANNVPGTGAVALDQNGPMNELMNVIENMAGLQGNASDDTLLGKALQKLIGAATENAVEQAIDANTIGVKQAGYSKTAQSLAFLSSDEVWRYIVASADGQGLDRVLSLECATSNGSLNVGCFSGASHSFLPGSQQVISNGTSTVLGNQKWQSFYIGNISGSGAQVTFPLMFSALPTVILQPTSEFNTNLAISANPVAGTLTTGGLQVNINTGPGTASSNGCGLWVWAFGAL